MIILRSLKSLVRWRQQTGTPNIVLVPTMGALHRGHGALLRRGRRLAGPDGRLVASIFVNPTQFGPKDDLARYPRPFRDDSALCRECGVDVLFAPAPEEMYAPGFSVFVEENALSQGLCGASRPGHFRGVCTVVAKLFGLVRPASALFGEKDFQQLAVIRRMVRDLNFAVRVLGVPTVREPDGLALSSRNRYLSPEERAQAICLRQALLAGRSLARSSGASVTAAEIKSAMQAIVARFPLAKADYLDAVHSETLEFVEIPTPARDRLIGAVWMGSTRLIDNEPC